MKEQHQPNGNSGFCTCGGEEQYYEYDHRDDPPSGYGCERAGRTYTRTLDRIGFHIHPERTAVNMPDSTFDSLPPEDIELVEKAADRWRKDWRGGR